MRGYCRKQLINENNTLNSNNLMSNTLNSSNLILDSLCNYVGHKCSCDFQINNTIVTKTGILENIGDNYILLRSTANNSKIMFCDTCNLRFITINS